MFQKFIINRDGVLKFGHVYLHRDMLVPGEQCTYGGGLWKLLYLPHWPDEEEVIPILIG